MKKNTCFAALVTSTAFFLTGCVDSPILHHADAAPSDSRLRAPQTDACPLAFSRAGVCANLTWVRMPSESEKGAFTLKFWSASSGSASGPYVPPPNSVFVKLWMPDMGHGSSPVTIIPAVDTTGAAVPGVFQVSDVYFVMSGTWEIWVQLREGTEVRDQAKIDLSIE